MQLLKERTLAVGDLVVYASHGVGRVVTREERTAHGRRQEVVVIEFAGGLSVSLPTDRVLQYVRPISTEDEITNVGRMLGEMDTVSEESWQRRLKATKGKVTGGDASGLAEVVRDACRREERSLARNQSGKLSLTERQLYLKARQLLADEIGVSRGVDPLEADAWIGEQIARNQA
jgi:CarD family transcriptional regulator